MFKRMNYTIFGLIVPILLLVSCSGWKKTSESSFSKPSSTNVNVDAGLVKVRGTDNSSSIKILGKEIKSKKKEQFFPENPKQFINGDVCKYCDYISRTENERGNLVESEIARGFRNGEEREYSDGMIIRSSVYTDGRRSGMEYYFSEGKLADSAQAETIFGYEWDVAKIKAALPEAIAAYIQKVYFQDSALGLYSFILVNDKITEIGKYHKKETDTKGDGVYTSIISIFYENHHFFSDFKVIFTKPFYEEMIFKGGNLVERKKIKGNRNVLEYRQGEFLKEFYDNGAEKRTLTGDVSSLLEENTEQCMSVCQFRRFYENGQMMAEEEYKNKKKVFEKQWNEKGILICEEYYDSLGQNLDSMRLYNDQGILIKDMVFPKYLRNYYDNGNLKDERVGDHYRDEAGLVHTKNGYIKNYYENGQMMSEGEYKNEKIVSEKQWNEKGGWIKEMYYDSLGKNPVLTKLYNDQGILIKDMLFPKYLRDYYDNGNIKVEWVGNLYRPEDGLVNVENGYKKSYYENGQMEGEYEYKNRKTVFEKQWNEKGLLKKELVFFDSLGNQYTEKKWNDNGVLIKDVNYPEYYRVFYDNGNLKDEWAGSLYATSLTTLRVKDGFVKHFYENGQNKFFKNYKDRKCYSLKLWYENGNLWQEGDMSKGFDREYNQNGKLQREVKGKFHYGEDFKIVYDSAEYKSFYPDGKKEFIATYKNNNVVTGKEWNSNGNLVSEQYYPKYWKTYYDNGMLQEEGRGVLFYDSLGHTQLKNGVIKIFYEDGGWKSIQTKKNGVTRNFKFRFVLDGEESLFEVGYDSLGVENTYIRKKNGILNEERYGVLYRIVKDDDDFEYAVDTGYEKVYHKNGKLKKRIEYEQKNLVRKKEWDEQEHLLLDVLIPDYYREYDTGGKLMQEAVGTIVEENGVFKVKEGVVKQFDSSGKVNYSATYKEFQVVSENNSGN